MEVATFKNVHVKNFVGKHLNFFLLKIRQLIFQVNELLVLHLLGYLLPFLFELKALIVILDTPLAAISFNFSGSWLGGGLRL